MNTIIRICKDLGVLLALGKIEGPSITLPFLGIMLDTVVMETRLPHSKLERMCNMVSTWLKKKKATKRELLSLVYRLATTCNQVNILWKIFSKQNVCHHCQSQAARLLYTFNRDFRSDLGWWNTLLVSWNGLSLLRNTPIAPQFHITEML